MKRVLEVIDGRSYESPPIWMMRQAGRYLPEYLATRKQAGGFLDLCYSPELAVEVTMQPIRRFGFDAAILFSDILVIPDALGVSVRFEEGRGPILEPVSAEDIRRLNTDNILSHLSPVFDTLKELSNALSEDTTLLGFCGGPWTVATYMIAGHGTPDQGPARLFAHRYPDDFQFLINTLVDASIMYLVKQIRSGADAVQIFDSWASVLDEDQMTRWCVEPVRQIVDGVRKQIPDAKIVGFPKGIGAYYKHYRRLTGVDMIGLDWAMPMAFAQELQQQGAIQGNLDPMRLIAGGQALEEGIDTILDGLAGGPLVFNLGHGVTPQTPIDHVETMVKRVREFRPG